MMAIIEANWPFLNVIIESPSVVEALASIIKGSAACKHDYYHHHPLPGELTAFMSHFSLTHTPGYLPFLKINSK